MTHKDRKRMIYRFMENNYSDEQLAALLAHTRDGKLAFASCCCFIGIPTARHALQGKVEGKNFTYENFHICAARRLMYAMEAEAAFGELCDAPDSSRLYYNNSPEGDAKRRRILIPMIRAEMRQRELDRIDNQVMFAETVGV